jgi:hypothetical protein
MFRRRQALLLLRSGLQLVGSRYSPDTQRLREFAARNRLAYSWIDLDSDPVGPALLRTLRLEVRDTPVALLGGGSVLVNPFNAEFATAAGIAAWARAQATPSHAAGRAARPAGPDRCEEGLRPGHVWRVAGARIRILHVPAPAAGSITVRSGWGGRRA